MDGPWRRLTEDDARVFFVVRHASGNEILA